MKKLISLLIFFSFFLASNGFADDTPSFFIEIQGAKNKCPIFTFPFKYCPCIKVGIAWDPQNDNTMKKRVTTSSGRVFGTDPMLLKQMEAMLSNGDIKSELRGAGELMTTYTLSQGILTLADSYSAALKDGGSLFSAQFPDYNAGTFIYMSNEEKRLADNWRKIEAGYMSAMSRSNARFESEQKIRNQLIDVLNEDKNTTLSPKDGQTKGLIAVTSLANQAAVLIERNDQSVSGFLEVQTLAKQTKRARKQAVRNNVLIMAKKAVDVSKSSSSFNLGF